ncbi:MAG TPA: flagellar motor switch protein FliN [Parvularculaceae bacterium]|nr:flagellar motor switch protein FliN [Parvularculaceae bacterium]
MSALENAKRPATLPELADNEEAPRAMLESIYDVPVRVTAVLGKKRMNVADLMRLDAGAVIELDRRVGEPIDLYVNDKLIARGELVLVDGVLGVTMTEVVKETDA